MKNYILVLLTALGLGILATPSVSRAEAVTPVETEIPLMTEIEPIAEITTPEISETKLSTYQITSVKSASTPVSTNSTSADYYAITTSSTEADCGQLSNDQVYHFGNLLFAHAYKAFSNLKYYTPGNTFTVSENGVVSTYRVSEVRYFEKTGATTLALCSNGLSDCAGNTPMTSIKNAYYVDENHIRHSYSVALMACAGTNDSHRIVVFANKI